MDLLSALNQTFDRTHSVIAGVRADQMANATPCSEWDVRALITHTMEVVAGIGRAIGANAGNSSAPEGASFTLGSDPAAQFRTLADTSLSAWRTTDLNSEVNIGAGPMPGNVALGINLLDTTTHAWDIARATGQPEALPEDLASVVLGICQNIVTEEARGFAGFHAAVKVADDANSTSKLVAFLGRQP